jgi:hypothetical protein
VHRARSVARRAPLALIAAASAVGLAALLLAPGAASAQTLDLAGAGMPSTIGRAGAGVVAADDGAALWLNPAGLARRSAWRAQLGLTWVARSATFMTAERFSFDPAEARQLAGPEVVPTLALEGHLGERVVVGLAWLEPTDLAFDWAAPDPDDLVLSGEGEQHDRARYPARYAAGRLALRKRGVAAGAAVRALPWLALGGSAWLLRVDAEQSRSLWGAQGPITSLPTLSSAYDLRFAASGHDYTPGGALGALVAPLDAPVELALSVSFGADAALAGTPTLSDSRGKSTDGSRLASASVAADASVTLALPTPLVARAGVRFFSERLSLEAGAAVASGGAATPVWRVEGVGMALGSASAPVDAVPVGVALRDGLSLGAAFDADVVPGFLTLSAGWSYARGAVARASLSPALPLLDTHTFALGATVRVEGYSVVLGVSYAPGAAVDVEPGAATVLAPLADGAPPAARGRLDASTTMIGLAVEAEL